MNKFVQPGRLKIKDETILMPEFVGLRMVFIPCSSNKKFDKKLDISLSKKWPKVKEDFKLWSQSFTNFKLGEISDSALMSDLWVVYGLCKNDEDKVDSAALEKCIKKLSALSKNYKGSLHFSSSSIEEIPELADMIEKELIQNGITVYLYNKL